MRRRNTHYYTFVVLNVVFELNKKYADIDKRVAKALGRRPVSAGIDIQNKLRSLLFSYEEEKKAQEAKRLLQKDGLESYIQTFERDVPQS